MNILTSIFLFIGLVVVVWLCAGFVIDAVHRISKRFNKTGFITAFFILGFLTSITEMSVAVNSSVQKVPGVSAGNLVGATFVVLLFIVPLLAVAGKGIQVRHTVSKANLVLALAVTMLPGLMVTDGSVSVKEGIVCLLAYLALTYSIYREQKSLPHARASRSLEDHKGRSTAVDILKVVAGAAIIFFASKVLVQEAVYFADLLTVPPSLVGLILLSIGTNIPELTVAARSILKRHKDIAFGDYIGSSAANTFIFSLLAIGNGGFTLDAGEFAPTAIVMALGLVFLYAFARSRSFISRAEGMVLLLFYACFLGIQIAYLVG